MNDNPVFYAVLVIMAVIVTLFTGFYIYSLKIVALKEKALAAGTPIVELACIDPNREQFAACMLLAQRNTNR